MSKKKKKKKRKVSPRKKRPRKKAPSSSGSTFRVGSELSQAVQYHQTGQLQKAAQGYESILRTNPKHPQALYLLGTIHHQAGTIDIAIDLYNKAIRHDPKNPIYYNGLGAAYQSQEKLSDAIACYKKVLELKPDMAEAHFNLGTGLQTQGKLNHAIPCYEKALRLNPDYAKAYDGMGTAFRDLGKLSKALSCYERAITLEPDYAEAHCNLATVLQGLGKTDEAIPFYQKALRLKPDLTEAHHSLGTAFQAQGKLRQAISSCRKALELNPDYIEVYSPLAFQLLQACAWEEWDDLKTQLNNVTNTALEKGTKTAEDPFLSIATNPDASHNLLVAQSWSAPIAGTMANSTVEFHFDGRISPEKKLVIGYLSNDFRDHPVAHLMAGLFGLHDRNYFEVFGYSYGKDDESAYRRRIQEDCDQFVDLRDVSHEDSAKRIYEDHVDILVDLNGHTGNSRMEICALCPAPLQVSYLGFPGTTGADFIDYTITDSIVTPKNQAPYYSEQLIYLPHCYMVTDHRQSIAVKEWNKADFGLPEDHFVFCSFNSPYKIEPLMFDLWMSILRELPRSVLWLREMSKEALSHLKEEAKDRGIEPERIIFAERLPSKEEHLARLRLVDLVLDTRIYNGHTTTSDSLWAGVPVITLEGHHFASRSSTSLLTSLDLTDLITKTPEEYHALAIHLAQNPDELQALRQKLEENRLKAPLFDTPRFVKNLESAYKEIWKIFVAGEDPRLIEVKE